MANDRLSMALLRDCGSDARVRRYVGQKVVAVSVLTIKEHRERLLNSGRVLAEMENQSDELLAAIIKERSNLAFYAGQIAMAKRMGLTEFELEES